MKLVFSSIIRLLSFLCLCLLATSCSSKKNNPSSATNQEVLELEEELTASYLMGIRTDTLDVIEGVVKEGWSLSAILGKYGVPMADVHRLSQLAKPIFDVRRIKSGHRFTALCTRDTLPQLRYLLYCESLTDYIIFDFVDSLQVYRRSKEIVRKPRQTQGVIHYSLWQSLHDAGTNVELSNALSDIYAWQIDFFAIQKGDAYQVVYDEYFVDDTVSVGIAEVHAARFNHHGKDYFAVRFEQDDSQEYFDEKGINLRKAFLKAPLKYTRISSRFSHGRMHPVLRIRRPHHGVDYAAPMGTPVMSIGSGTVIKKAYQKNGGGNYVTIKHNGTYTTSYMHLQSFAKGLTVGQKVSQGEVIGYVGSTGLSTGPHLDFRVYRDGQPIDPLTMESPAAAPLKESLRDSFLLVRNHALRQLGYELDSTGMITKY